MADRLPKGEPVKVKADRRADGKFAKGCTPGPGNPMARKVWEVRQRICAAVTDQDIDDITRSLVEQAKAGDVQAACVLFDRMMGKPTQPVSVEAPNTNNEGDVTTWDDARIVKFHLDNRIPEAGWPPGILARYKAGMVKGYPKQLEQKQ